MRPLLQGPTPAASAASPIRRLIQCCWAKTTTGSGGFLTLWHRFLHLLAKQLVHAAGQHRGEGVAQLLAQLLLELLLLLALALRHQSAQFALCRGRTSRPTNPHTQEEGCWLVPERNSVGEGYVLVPGGWSEHVRPETKWSFAWFQSDHGAPSVLSAGSEGPPRVPPPRLQFSGRQGRRSILSF